MNTKYLFTNTNNYSIPNKISDTETPLSKQSKNYKKYQNTLLEQVKLNHKQLFYESFDSMDNNINLEPTNYTNGSINVLKSTKPTQAEIQANENLLQNYNTTLQQYNSLLQITNSTLITEDKDEINQNMLQLQSLEKELNNLAQQLNSNNISIYTDNYNVNNQTTKDRKLFAKFLNQYNEIEEKYKNTHTYQGILNDSDIVVLQKNYSYFLWSILALGVVITTLNIIRN